VSGTFDERLLAKLACPVTRTPLRYDPAMGVLVSDAARLAFPIREGVPVLLVDEARPLSEVGSAGINHRSG